MRSNKQYHSVSRRYNTNTFQSTQQGLQLQATLSAARALGAAEKDQVGFSPTRHFPIPPAATPAEEAFLAAEFGVVAEDGPLEFDSIFGGGADEEAADTVVRTVSPARPGLRGVSSFAEQDDYFPPESSDDY